VDFGFGMKRMGIGRWEWDRSGLSVVNPFAFILNGLLARQCPWPNVLLQLERLECIRLTEFSEACFLIQRL